MTTLYEGAFAKINLTLDVLGKREDGYHDLESVMQTISLRDDIEIDVGTGKPWVLKCEKEGVPCDSRNLAWKAAETYARVTGIDFGGIEIRITKRIPSEAGLGGGSADAAAVLVGLNRLWGLNLPQEELEKIGLTLGADVPFCIRGGLTRTTGIGERMENLPCGRMYPLVVVQPCEGLSTKEIFQAYHDGNTGCKPKNKSAIHALKNGKRKALADSMGNVMQPISQKRRSDISKVIHKLCRNKAFAAQMTGSGSAVFGAFQTKAQAEAAYLSSRKMWDRTFLCETCMESVVIEDEHQD